MLLNHSFVGLEDSRLIPPICLRWRVLFGVTVSSFGNFLFELGGEMFLLGVLLLRMPKFVFAVVNASITLMWL